MEILQQGSTGDAVRSLQRKLNKVLDLNLIVDGRFGTATVRAVRQYQTSVDQLVVDGIAGPNTMASLNRLYAQYADQFQMLGRGKFVVFVDAGHGGRNRTGRYVTPGKRWYHDGAELHHGGDYYEGVENRIIAERFIERCTALGIHCIRTYHPWKDTPLSARSELVRSYLEQGYSGYLHSFHSNAISRKNTPEKLEATRGFMVFTTSGNTFSDQIATQHFEHVRNETSNDWQYRKQTRDGDVDFEVNFQLLRETDMGEFALFGAILEEWGFHTSRADTTDWITSSRGRASRVEAAVRTAQWVRGQFHQYKKPDTTASGFL